MRYAVDLPPFGAFAEPSALVELAVAAEEAGWDGLFVWDHVVRVDNSLPVADPWVALAAVAAATSRIRLGPMVTPLARRRPWVVARQSVTLDRLSGGRLVLGVGLGNDHGRELSAFGEETDPVARAALLNESLDVLTALWSGEPTTHHGDRLTVDGIRFLPAPVQRPRIPIWVAGEWPNRAPMRRAARYDGAFPFATKPFTTDDVATLLGIVERHRPPGAGPFDLVVSGRGGAHHDGTPADLEALEAAGVTWWFEALAPYDSADDARALVAAGPPRPGRAPARRARPADSASAADQRDELLDVVDDEDRVVGQARRGDIYAGRLRHRTTMIVVRDPDGRVLVHRRAPTKLVLASMLDMMIGGVVGAGEGYEACAARELAEEVGVSGVPLRPVERFRYDGHIDADGGDAWRQWIALYETTWDGPVVPQDSEISWWDWLPPDEVDARLAAEPSGWCPDSRAAWQRYRATVGS